MMNRPLDQKSSLEEIKQRFDNDVERFSNLETGQSATIDAPLAMELIAQAAVRSTADIRRVLDIGCGAGNNTLKLLQYVSPFDCDLIYLSLPMLEKARERISSVNSGRIKTIQGDFRDAIDEQLIGHFDLVTGSPPYFPVGRPILNPQTVPMPGLGGL